MTGEQTLPDLLCLRRSVASHVLMTSQFGELISELQTGDGGQVHLIGSISDSQRSCIRIPGGGRGKNKKKKCLLDDHV